MDRYDEIVRKLAELRKFDSKLLIWGAKKHGHSMYARLRKDEIERYEQEFEIVLPREYTELLCRVGGGGAGPGVGLYPLNKSIQIYETLCKRCRNPPDSHVPYVEPSLAIAFPVEMDLASAICRALNQPVESGDIYARRYRPKLSMPDTSNGLLEISNSGCSTEYLVVTGPMHGHVFHLCDAGYWIPACHDDRPITFLDWYEGWLDCHLDLDYYNGWVLRQWFD